MIKIERETAETKIELELDLYGEGKYEIETGVGFFNHMLELVARHGFWDIRLIVEGDLDVDAHHTVEDTGIVLGQGIKKQLGNKAGIQRYGDVILPMDESLVLIAVDLGGRPYLEEDLSFTGSRVGDFPVELFKEFFLALTNKAEFNLHFNMLRGGNNHHILEAAFKGFARAFSEAIANDRRLKGQPLSTKGSLREDED